MRKELVANTYAENTRVGYAKDLADFEAWCKSAGRAALPAESETLALYLTDRLERNRVTTLERRLTGILHANRAAGHARPSTEECRAILTGARRRRKERARGKAALAAGDLRRIARRLLRLGTNRAVRDRALLVFGFASGLRRGELAAVDVGDVAFAPKGLVLVVASSKTDQEGRGAKLGIFRGSRPETDPVSALRAWLRVRGSVAGALFTHVTTGDAVTLQRLRPGGLALAVKDAVALVGLDRSLYSPHSLRAGCVTAAYNGGASDLAIMRRARHASLRTTAGYERGRDPFGAVNPLARAL